MAANELLGASLATQTVAHTSLGASAALLPVLLWPICGAAVSTACIGAAMELPMCSYSGFHAYVQTFGAIVGVTNLCGIVAELVVSEYLGNAVAVTGPYALMFATTDAVNVFVGGVNALFAWAAAGRSERKWSERRGGAVHGLQETVPDQSTQQKPASTRTRSTESCLTNQRQPRKVKRYQMTP
jgi:hypothetical protein